MRTHLPSPHSPALAGLMRWTRTTFFRRLLLIGCLCALSACGGGGGGTDPTSAGGGSNSATPANTAALQLSGTAATGKAMAGATVSVKCRAGTGQGSTAADGRYSLTVSAGSWPCLVAVTDTSGGLVWHGVAVGPGTSAVADVTPLTELLRLYAVSCGTQQSHLAPAGLNG